MTSQSVGLAPATTDSSLASRLERAAADLEAHNQLTEAKIELRNRLVLEAIDSGWRVDDVARTAHVARSRIWQIVRDHG